LPATIGVSRSTQRETLLNKRVSRCVRGMRTVTRRVWWWTWWRRPRCRCTSLWGTCASRWGSERGARGCCWPSRACVGRGDQGVMDLPILTILLQYFIRGASHAPHETLAPDTAPRCTEVLLRAEFVPSRVVLRQVYVAGYAFHTISRHYQAQYMITHFAPKARPFIPLQSIRDSYNNSLFKFESDAARYHHLI
jgi:hypothetical protein